jgi:putative iron-dependent peroxidase
MSGAPQPAILLPPLAAGHVLSFRLTAPQQGKPLLRALAAWEPGEHSVVGLGLPLVSALKGSVPGLRAFPPLDHPDGTALPVTPADVWVYVRGADGGEVFERVRAFTRALPGGVAWVEDLPTFLYRGGRDLTGYEDGTENPTGEGARAAALVPEAPLAGGSFVAAMRWTHDLDGFAALPPSARDRTIGRAIADNAELGDAPASAHVKRTAQESFAPPATMLRRSMPWGGARERGLYFVAYVADLDRFERMWRRMLGLDDGVPDALFGFSRPTTAAWFWCPPMRDGRLDLAGVLPPGGVDALPDVEVPVADGGGSGSAG